MATYGSLTNPVKTVTGADEDSNIIYSKIGVKVTVTGDCPVPVAGIYSQEGVSEATFVTGNYEPSFTYKLSAPSGKIVLVGVQGYHQEYILYAGSNTIYPLDAMNVYNDTPEEYYFTDQTVVQITTHSESGNIFTADKTEFLVNTVDPVIVNIEWTQDGGTVVDTKTFTFIGVSDTAPTANYVYLTKNTINARFYLNSKVPLREITGASGSVPGLTFGTVTRAESPHITWILIPFTGTYVNGSPGTYRYSVGFRHIQGGTGSIPVTFIIPAVVGSGTSDDPWTRWDGSAYQFWQAVTDGATYYATLGARFYITDTGDPAEEDYFVDSIAPDLGIGVVNWNASGTATTAGTTNIVVQFNDLIEEEENYKTIHLVILGNGPTLNIRVSGAWKEGKPYVKVNGTWKEATKVYIKVNGAWKESK